ncbi:MAG TPA: thioredoxin [Gemmatimonadaceae bacterium]|nr:thioredoxin [Gemmatimonadaceae bacterium]
MTESSATTATNAKHVTVRCPFCQTWNRVNVARVGDKPKCGHCGRPLLLDRPISLGDEDFARTIAESDVPVLVDFYADWCGPCKAMAPYVDDLAARYQGRLLVAKLDTDRAVRTASAYNVRGIPTAIVFRAGKEAARQVGAAPAKVLEELVGAV